MGISKEVRTKIPHDWKSPIMGGNKLNLIYSKGKSRRTLFCRLLVGFDAVVEEVYIFRDILVIATART